MQVSKSAKLYQERRIPSDRTTRRIPAPRIAIGTHPTVQIPLSPPYPTNEVLRKQQDNVNDSQSTLPWPHGEAELR